MKNLDDALLQLSDDGRMFVELDEHTKQVRVVFVWHDVYNALAFYDKLMHHLQRGKDLVFRGRRRK